MVMVRGERLPAGTASMAACTVRNRPEPSVATRQVGEPAGGGGAVVVVVVGSGVGSPGVAVVVVGGAGGPVGVPPRLHPTAPAVATATVAASARTVIDRIVPSPLPAGRAPRS